MIEKGRLINNLFEELIEEVEYCYGRETELTQRARIALQEIEEQPKVEERHGRWIKEPGAWHLDDEKRTSVNILKCSECGMYYQNAPYNFCPNCGVPMDKE